MRRLEVLGPEPGKAGAEILTKEARLWCRGHDPIIARPSDGLTSDEGRRVRGMTIDHETLTTVLLGLAIVCAFLYIVRR